MFLSGKSNLKMLHANDCYSVFPIQAGSFPFPFASVRVLPVTVTFSMSTILLHGLQPVGQRAPPGFSPEAGAALPTTTCLPTNIS